MTPLRRLTAVAAPLVRDDINTDVIIPSREMKTVSRIGLADGLFADWRYTQVGGREPVPGFILNAPLHTDARILIVGRNFGCGSSREHAAWALHEYGFRAIIAESFNPIFRGNAVLNGIAPVVLPRRDIDKIAAQVAEPGSNEVRVDLEVMLVTAPDESTYPFKLDGEARQMLLDGLDAIDLTYLRRAEIDRFRREDRARRPWAYGAAL